MRVWLMNTMDDNVKMPVLMVRPGIDLSSFSTSGISTGGANALSNALPPVDTQELFDATNTELVDYIFNRNLGPQVMSQNERQIKLPYNSELYQNCVVAIAPHSTVTIPSFYGNYSLEKSSQDQGSPWMGDQDYRDAVIFRIDPKPGQAQPYKLMTYPMRYDSLTCYNVSSDTSRSTTIVLCRDDNGYIRPMNLIYNRNRPTAVYHEKVIVSTASTHGSHAGGLDQDFWRQQTGRMEGEEMNNNCYEVPNILNRYNPRIQLSGTGYYPLTKEQLRDFQFSLADKTIFENIAQAITGNPTDYIIGIKWYYGIKRNLDIINSDVYLKLGGFAYNGAGGGASIVTKPAASEMVQMDMLSPTIVGKFNNYLDNSPYTKLEVYIPYVGFTTLDMTEVIGKKLWLRYTTKMDTGATIVHLFKESDDCWEVMLELQCIMGSDILINVKGVDTLLSRLASSLYNVGTVGLGYVNPGIATAASLASLPSTNGTQHRTGTINNETGSMGVFVPFIRYTRPEPIQPANYDMAVGRPDVRTGKLSSFTSSAKYVKVGNIYTGSSLSIPKEAFDEVESLLRGGVYYA